jgi:hypothetical protein
MYRKTLIAIAILMSGLSAQAAQNTTCVFDSPELGAPIKARGIYETALEKVSTQCLAKRSELLRNRHSNMSHEAFKDQQIEFAEDCVNHTTCTET